VFRGPALSFRYDANTYDSFLYPTKGSRVALHFRQALGTDFISVFDIPDSLDVENRYEEYRDPYWHVTADLENYLPLGKNFSLNSEIAIGLSDNDKPFTDNFYLGGYRYNQRQNQVAFVGLQSHELLQGNYLKGKLALQVKAMSNLYVSALANLVFVTDDNATMLDDIINWNDEARYLGAGAGFTYKTPVGPVSVFFGSRTDVWNPIWYTNIGFTF